MDQSLRDFIKKQRDQGASDEQIRHALEANGWRQEDITAALGASPDMPPTVTAAKPLLEQTLHIYGERFWTLLALTFIPALIILSGLVLGLITGAVSALTAGSQAIIIALVVLVGLVIVAAAIYFGLWSQVAMITIIRDRHETLTLGEAFRRSRQYIVPLFTTGLLSGVLILGALSFFIIPGIIIALLFSFAQYIVVVEGKTNFAALMHSRDYVVGRTKTIFARMIVLVLILWIITVAAKLLFDIVGGILSWPTDVSDGLGSFLNIVTAPISVVYTMLLYESARSLPTAPRTRSEEDSKKYIIGFAVGGGVVLALVGILIFIASQA